MSNSSRMKTRQGGNDGTMMMAHGRHGKARRFAGRAALITLVALLTVAALGCYNTRTGRVDVGGSINFKLPAFTQTGSHAVQIFTEMHYQPSYRVQEGPRILPPPDSVPVTGREIEYDTAEAYQALQIPDAIAESPNTLTRARETYDVNCLVCHGSNLRGEDGDATILPYLANASGARPRNLVDVKLSDDGEQIIGAASDATTDGEIYAWITYGGQAGFASALRDRPTTSWMPQFINLLSEEERWELVALIRSEQAK